MRFTNLLAAVYAPGCGRNPQPPNRVPFQELLPMKLKDRVSGKSDKSKEPGCLHEIHQVIACLEKNEHQNLLCNKEISSLTACYNRYRIDSFKAKRTQEKGVLVPGEKSFTHKQLKKLFQRRPMQ